MRLQANTFNSRFEWAAFKNEIRNSNTNKLKGMLSLLLKEIFEMTSSHQELAHRWNQIAIILDERDLRFLRDEKDCYFEVKFNQAPLQAHQAWKLAEEHYWESPPSRVNADCIDHAIDVAEQAKKRLQVLLLKIMESSPPPPYAPAVAITQRQSAAAQPQPQLAPASVEQRFEQFPSIPYAHYRLNPYCLSTNVVFFKNKLDRLNESKRVSGIVIFSG